MKSARKAKPSIAELMRQGQDAYQAGRFYLAAKTFAAAHDAEPRNPEALFQLARAKARTEDMLEALPLLTKALRLRPSWEEPARWLGMLLRRFRVPNIDELDPHGLLVAFSFDRIDQKAIAAASLEHLKVQTGLGKAIAEADAGRGEQAARALILKRTDKVLINPLFLAILSHSHNCDPGLERLLTAIRRVLLLEVPADRFADKMFTNFVHALVEQCILNEHVFVVEGDERERLNAHAIDWVALEEGNPEAARTLLLTLLYEAPQNVLAGRLTVEACRSLRPKALGAFLAEWLQEEEHHRALAVEISTLTPIEDETSRKVAQQYEAHPYPRFSSLQMPVPSTGQMALKRFLPPERLGFLNDRFKVLIAGAGTGQHAIVSAARYGPQADVLAIDLSRRSLAYAKAKAAHFGVENLRFAQADIQSLGTSEGPFDIIESVGVLHHMAEPFKGWQALIELCRPGGMMFIGLYSAVARSNLARLRTEPDYPGPSCGNDTARAYRAELMTRGDAGAELLIASHDFYTMSDFRDLVLHEHERPMVLSEIEAFIQENGLIFRGFEIQPPIVDEFLRTSPEHTWPGTLAQWSEFEEKQPRTFDSMYRLWCEKAA